MAVRDPLDDLVHDFVAQLRDVIKQQIRASLEGSFTGDKRGGKALALSGNGHYRAKGEKRPPAELEALQSRVLEFIAQSPGLRIEQINRELGTTTKDLALPIRKLVAEKMISTKGAKRATTYFAKAAKAGKGKRAS